LDLGRLLPFTLEYPIRPLYILGVPCSQLGNLLIFRRRAHPNPENVVCEAQYFWDVLRGEPLFEYGALGR
jgi:hypothetical protein